MAIKVNNTTVIDDSRVLQNVTGLKTVGGQSLLGSGDVTVDSVSVGAVQQFVGSGTDYPGTQWLLANGTVKLQSQYPVLYSRLGTIPNGFTNAANWTVVTTNSATNQGMPTIRYANNLYFGIGSNYDSVVPLRTSTDLNTWNTVTTVVDRVIGGPVYANGTYYLGFNYSGVVTTTDFVNYSGISNRVDATAYYNGVYVAAGSDSSNSTSIIGPYSSSTGVSKYYSPGVRTATSLTGTWTSRNVGFNDRVNNVCAGPTQFVVVGDNGKIATSTNGTTWTTRTSNTTANILNVVYTNSLYMYTGVGVVGTSPDGITWTVRATGYEAYTLGPAVYGGGRYVVCCRSSIANYAGYLTSTDLVTWSTSTSGSYTGGSDLVYNNIQYVSGKFVSSADRGGQSGTGIYTSTTGTGGWLSVAFNYQTFVPNAARTKIYYLEYSGTNLLVKGTDTAVTNPTTVATLSIVGLPLQDSTNRSYSAKQDSTGLRFKLMYSNYYVTSTDDGTTWQLVQNTSEDYNYHTLMYENGLFFTTISQNSTNPSAITNIYTSTDAVSWTKRGPDVVGGYTSSVVYNPTTTNKYVAASSAGKVLTSTDAVTWTLRDGYSATTTTGYSNMVYGFNKFIVQNTRQLITSTDAVTWSTTTNGTLTTNTGFSNLVYVNNTLFTKDDSTFQYSKDGESFGTISYPDTVMSGRKYIFVNNKLIVPRAYYGVQYTSEYTYNPATEFALPVVSTMNGQPTYIKAI